MSASENLLDKKCWNFYCRSQTMLWRSFYNQNFDWLFPYRSIANRINATLQRGMLTSSCCRNIDWFLVDWWWSPTLEHKFPHSRTAQLSSAVHHLKSVTIARPWTIMQTADCASAVNATQQHKSWHCDIISVCKIHYVFIQYFSHKFTLTYFDSRAIY